MDTNVDIASENEQVIRDNAIAKAKAEQAAKPKLVPKGRCHNPVCDDDLENPDAIFCPGGQCAQEYEQVMSNKGKRTLKVW